MPERTPGAMIRIRKGCRFCVTVTPSWYVASDGEKYCLVHALKANANMLRAAAVLSRSQLELKAEDLERKADRLEAEGNFG